MSIEIHVLTIKAFGILAAALLFSAPAFPGNRRSESSLTLDSSDRGLVEAFNWAKRQALAFAFDGDPVGPWYEAALPGREAFCMRDVSHQAMGAQALGLALHTRNMLHRFAENISASKDWCSYWEIDRYNRPPSVDYKNDDEFWYCLPANYDVLDACYRMYLWTGDLAYIDDAAFLNFYNRTVTDFEQRWSLDRNQVMGRKRFENIRGGDFDPHNRFIFFRGNPSYDESHEDFVLGVDLLATQYAAYRAYAGIQNALRNSELAQMYTERAAAVKTLINGSWWDEPARQFHARLNKDYQFEGHDTSNVLYRDAADDGPKLKDALNAFLDEIKKTPSSGVEGQSHHAEILYRYGAPDAAYAQMMDLARPGRYRREYPEVSYSIVGAIVTGLMGVSSGSLVQQPGYGRFGEQFIGTQSGLGHIGWAEIRNLPVRRNKVTVRHEGGRKTVFTNQEGPSLIWRAVFPGAFETLLLNGKSVKARVEHSALGHEISSIDIPVAPGVTVEAETPN